MPVGKMHVDEVDTDESLVRRLLRAQYPQWAELAIEPVHSAGTDNAIYRLGDELAVRLPRIESATEQVDLEGVWLPRLAPFLPLAIPVPLAAGAPGEGYPWRWSVYRWLAGENASIARISDLGEVATDLARFIAALRGAPVTGWPPPEPPISYRGGPLAQRDEATRAAIAALDGMLDAVAVTAAWDAALRAPAWDGPPVWIHGDIMSLNMLIERGRLSAVIDFGCMGVGDPACDLIPAWNFFDAETRNIFRAALAVDDATWARGRGWSLSISLIALPYYHVTNPALANVARHAIAEILAETST